MSAWPCGTSVYLGSGPYPGGPSQSKIPTSSGIRVHCKWPTFSVHAGFSKQGLSQQNEIWWYPVGWLVADRLQTEAKKREEKKIDKRRYQQNRGITVVMMDKVHDETANVPSSITVCFWRFVCPPLLNKVWLKAYYFKLGPDEVSIGKMDGERLHLQS